MRDPQTAGLSEVSLLQFEFAADLIAPPDADYANLDDEAVTRLSRKLANWAAAQPRPGGGRDESASGELEPLLVLATPPSCCQRQAPGLAAAVDERVRTECLRTRQRYAPMWVDSGHRRAARSTRQRCVNQAYVVVGKQVVGPKSVEITR